jgi:hypothetical protein
MRRSGISLKPLFIVPNYNKSAWRANRKAFVRRYRIPGKAPFIMKVDKLQTGVENRECKVFSVESWWQAGRRSLIFRRKILFSMKELCPVLAAPIETPIET